ncbi:uncharacterized protein LOC124123545 isoform X2 [Haliotis rufescens]|nr:uncharacterized protein LOC124123545 isoform X2 [Haliotis rufescens]XP_048250484.1 uncharacterized protein LOC124123545 isoform X2 [Haliotis rufescens]
MEGAETAIEVNLSCSICIEVLRDPKTLQCLHNFCSTCLQKYLDSSTRHNPRVSGIACPICKEETQVADPSRPVSQWVNQLRTNCSIRNTIEEGLHTPANKDCDICRDDDRAVQAEFQCSTCQLTFCQSCHRVHRRIPTCENHTVRRIATSPPLKHECYNININLKKNASSSQRKKMSMRVRNEIKSKIDVIYHRGMENIKQKKEKLTEDTDAVIDEVLEKFDTSYPVPANAESDYSSSEDSGEEDSEKVVVTIKLSSKVETFINSSYEASLASARTTFDFKEADDPRLPPPDSDISGIETIEVLVNMDDLEDSESDEEDKMEELSPSYLGTTDGKIEDEDDPWIKSILVMNSLDMETIIVTDNNNSCVKSFYTDEGGDHHSRLELPGKPWGLTELKNERIAVTSPEQKAIYTIRVNPELEMQKVIKVGKKLFSVATVDADAVVACAQEEHPPALYIINMKGTILKTIARFRNCNLLESPTCIAMSPWGDYNYLVAEKRGKILSITKEGIPGMEVDTELQQPLQWITCSSDGKLFIVDKESNKVVWVREGKDNMTVLSEEHGILFPKSVCLHRGAMFVVEQRGTIKKFQLTKET